MKDILARLGLRVLERGWLSSNIILFPAVDGCGAALVDSGYDTHAGQTAEWVQGQLGGEPLARLLNTHLHSDHCGGNAALQERWPAQTWVPAPSFEAVTHWREDELTYNSTSQRCRRFRADGSLEGGDTVCLGRGVWQVYPAPGHDPHAVMLFQPDERVLISADALWEDRLAILFPELVGEPGLEPASRVLDLIEELAPKVVIPGHGAPFRGVESAIRASRRRIEQFSRDPMRHTDYAMRALVMFHMLEHRSREEEVLVAWLSRAPFFLECVPLLAGGTESPETAARLQIDRLVQGGSLKRRNGRVEVTTA